MKLNKGQNRCEYNDRPICQTERHRMILGLDNSPQLSTAFDREGEWILTSGLKDANPRGYQKTDNLYVLENLQQYLAGEISCAQLLSREEFTNDGARWLCNNYKLNEDGSHTSTIPGLSVVIRVDPFSETVGRTLWSAYMGDEVTPLCIIGNTISHLRVSPASIAWKLKNELDALEGKELDKNVLDPDVVREEKLVHDLILRYIEKSER